MDGTNWRETRHPCTSSSLHDSSPPAHAAAVKFLFNTSARPTGVHLHRPSPKRLYLAWWTEPTHQLTGSEHLFPRELVSPRRKTKNRERKKEKKRKGNFKPSPRRIAAATAAAYPTLIESKPLRHGITIEPLVEPTFSALASTTTPLTG